jgi:hypothetical protein
MRTPTRPGGSVGAQVPARAAPAPSAQITVTANRITWSSHRSPPFAADGPDQDEMRMIGIGPVIAAGPRGEGAGQGRRRPPVGR